MRGKHLNCGIRGGLWEEAHLLRMGPAVWLFGWLIHRQTRERDGIGLVLGGSPLTYEAIHQDTGIAVRTLKRWMARLGRCGYIRVTHVARKRMVIQIAKAKKFGPQQLGFPQNGPTFPQPPLFSSNSKGPLLARFQPSKGPLLAPLNPPAIPQPAANSDACGHRAALHRENKPERQKEKARRSASFRVPDDSASTAPVEKLPENRAAKRPARTPGGNEAALLDPVTASRVSIEEFSRLVEKAVQRYYRDSTAHQKLRREAELQAELRVGLGPEVHRESG